MYAVVVVVVVLTYVSLTLYANIKGTAKSLCYFPLKHSQAGEDGGQGAQKDGLQEGCEWGGGVGKDRLQEGYEWGGGVGSPEGQAAGRI